MTIACPSSEQRRVTEQSTITFKEESSGVYTVVKDRFDKYPHFVTTDVVVADLNSEFKVAVVRLDQSLYTNFKVYKTKVLK